MIDSLRYSREHMLDWIEYDAYLNDAARAVLRIALDCGLFVQFGPDFCYVEVIDPSAAHDEALLALALACSNGVFHRWEHDSRIAWCVTGYDPYGYPFAGRIPWWPG